MADPGDLISQLQELGLSGYEAKAYLVLIASEHPLNGYEVAKRSGVPRSTVYETLAKLSARGAAFEVRDRETTTYLALPPEALLRRVRDRVEQSLNALALQLDEIAQPRAAPISHPVEGEAVIELALDLISSARRELYIAGWRPQIVELSSAVLAAEDRGVDVTLVQFGDGPPVDGLGTRGDPLRNVRQRGAYELLLVVKDRTQSLVGAADGQALWALYSDDPAVVTLASAYVRADLSLQVLVEHVGLAEATSVLEAARESEMTRRRATPDVERRLPRGPVAKLRLTDRSPRRAGEGPREAIAPGKGGRVRQTTSTTAAKKSSRQATS